MNDLTLISVPTKKWKRWLRWQTFLSVLTSLIALAAYTCVVWVMSGIFHDYVYILDSRSHIEQLHKELVMLESKLSKLRIGAYKWENKKKKEMQDGDNSQGTSLSK